MEELKPCPFCSGEAELHDGSIKDSCFCRNEQCILFAKLFSITAWNTRPSPWRSVNQLPERKGKEDFAGDFLMFPLTGFKCCTYASGLDRFPVGFYDHRNKKWIVPGVSNSYKPTHYRNMPLPPPPEKEQ